MLGKNERIIFGDFIATLYKKEVLVIRNASYNCWHSVSNCDVPGSWVWGAAAVPCWSSWAGPPATRCSRRPAGTWCPHTHIASPPSTFQCLFTLMDFPSFIILFAASLEIVLASERSMITCLQAIRGFVISISTGNYQLHLSGSGQHVTNILSLKGIVRQRTLL